MPNRKLPEAVDQSVALAKYPNVSLKLSSANAQALLQYRSEKAKCYAELVVAEERKSPIKASKELPGVNPPGTNS